MPHKGYKQKPEVVAARAARQRGRKRPEHGKLISQIQRGERNPGWKGETVSSGGVHYRLKVERGPASNHSCVDCGGPATEWSFDQPRGFSTDLSRYAPRCRRCHVKQDGRGQATRLKGDNSPEHQSKAGQIANHIRWHVRRRTPCGCNLDGQRS